MAKENKTNGVASDDNIKDIIAQEATSVSLPVGIHHGIRLVSIEPINNKPDMHGNIIKKQLYLRFKKFNDDGDNLGQKDISFFRIDPSKQSSINNLSNFIKQVTDILRIYFDDEKEMYKLFDPIKTILYKAEVDAGRSDEDIEDDYRHDFIKTVLKKAAQYKNLELDIMKQFNDILEDKIGPNSIPFKLKLEESKDGKFIQIPMFKEFIEKDDVLKKDSKLYQDI